MPQHAIQSTIAPPGKIIVSKRVQLSQNAELAAPGARLMQDRHSQHSSNEKPPGDNTPGKRTENWHTSRWNLPAVKRSQTTTPVAQKGSERKFAEREDPDRKSVTIYIGLTLFALMVAIGCMVHMRVPNETISGIQPSAKSTSIGNAEETETSTSNVPEASQPNEAVSGSSSTNDRKEADYKERVEAITKAASEY